MRQGAPYMQLSTGRQRACTNLYNLLRKTLVIFQDLKQLTLSKLCIGKQGLGSSISREIRADTPAMIIEIYNNTRMQNVAAQMQLVTCVVACHAPVTTQKPVLVSKESSI